MPTTQMHKSERNGWGATTVIPMGAAKDHHGEDAERTLQIRTYKDSRGGLTTSASCSMGRDGLMMFSIFGDFYKTVLHSAVRCTEKTVMQQHGAALEQTDALLEQAQAFYADKEAAEKRTTDRKQYLADMAAANARQAAAERCEDDAPYDTPCIEDGRDNCNDWGTGEGKYHGRI